ncbi:hypothetical protein DLAC_09767 [Tieghemostelium lacteum]|uniref:tRNA (guanine(26)-N(2))-dimethyltransferase n=1 Tax=Tieghemostelium lacteum TaxID=361077 RepID=A0A151Z791_TIELA|nr:hypothetical protein DLAC_09767 [Tieghemostelium lacteum]|eukprot:KYQ89797.1 hypothetical protein DLAC_09767 [Tieghemostelium lacteum]
MLNRFTNSFRRSIHFSINIITYSKYNKNYIAGTRNLFKSNQINMEDVNTTSTTTTTTSNSVPMSIAKIESEMTPNTIKVSENTTTILYNNENEVFYNPVQEFNRDMSILMIKQFIQIRKKEAEAKGKPFKKVKILEALSATGLRSIRYAKEIGDVEYILANDIEQSAVDSINKNSVYNGVEEGLIRANRGDASMVMMQNKDFPNNYDVVDVDPYGSPAKFLDSAVQVVSEGGLLCITATDAAILCGSYPETCFHKYSTVPLTNSGYCHEMGLRILLKSIETTANKYKRVIVPILSLSVDFYMRVFVRVYTSPLEAKKSMGKMCNVFSCIGCGSFHIQPCGVVIVDEQNQNKNKYKVPFLNKEMGTQCEHCTKPYVMAGPFYNAPLHNVEILKSALKYLDENPTLFNTVKRMYGVLTSASEELPDLFYWKVDHFSHVLHLTTPQQSLIRSAILNAGYQTSSSHIAPVLKTNAPQKFLWDVWRAYAKEHPPKQLSETSPAYHILAKEIQHKIDFTEHPLAKGGESANIPKYLPNPKENWGPKARAGTKKSKKRTNDEMNNEMNNNNNNNNNQEQSTDTKSPTKPMKEKKQKLLPSEYPCQQYLKKGYCKKGDQCKNSHSITNKPHNAKNNSNNEI